MACDYSCQWNYFNCDVWYWIIPTVHHFVPFFPILICNFLIIFKLVKTHGARKTQMHTATAKDDGKLTSTTLMRLGLGFVFLVLSMPWDLYQIMYHLSSLDDSKSKSIADLFNA